MARSASNHITSCTISWQNTGDVIRVVTKALQTEIQVRYYDCDNLISGRIWPMSEQQKQELYIILYDCLEDWDCDDYTVKESDCNHWQFKICTQRSCLRTVCGTTNPPPHGAKIKKVLTEIIGEDNCYFY